VAGGSKRRRGGKTQKVGNKRSATTALRPLPDSSTAAELFRSWARRRPCPRWIGERHLSAGARLIEVLICWHRSPYRVVPALTICGRMHLRRFPVLRTNGRRPSHFRGGSRRRDQRMFGVEFIRVGKNVLRRGRCRSGTNSIVHLRCSVPRRGVRPSDRSTSITTTTLNVPRETTWSQSDFKSWTPPQTLLWALRQKSTSWTGAFTIKRNY